MTPRLAAITFLCVTLISIGQILFKKAALNIPINATWQSWAFNYWLFSAFALYGMTTLLWIWILRNTSLQAAYPFMGLAFLIVPCLERIIFGQPLRVTTVIGGLLIFAGVAISSKSAGA